MLDEGRTPVISANTRWHEALDHPGACSVSLSLVPVEAPVASATGRVADRAEIEYISIMSNKAYFIALSMSVLLLAAGFAPELWGVEADMPELLLDDFSSDVSTIGTRWDGFTDRVMGGVSDMRLGIAREAGIPYLSMSGNVSLANRGGFIQARLMLEENGRRHFDASAYRGIRVVVRGEGDGYYLFLRTASMVFPWAFYMASIPVTGEWQEVRIPWSAFEKGDFGTASPLDLRRLRSVAVTAYKKEFTADLAVREIGLY